MGKIKKITKATLKSLARKWKLFGRIRSEFDWMTDWMSWVKKNLQSFTQNDIDNMWMTRNYLRRDSDTEVKLSNCCYVVVFNF